MHELLILNIIRKKFEIVHKEFNDEFAKHIHHFLWNMIPINQVNTDVDCIVRISLYPKHLANSGNEGIDFEAHIDKTNNFRFTIDLNFIQSNGALYEWSVFAMDLNKTRTEKELILIDLFKTIDIYKSQITENIYKDYLPKSK